MSEPLRTLYNNLIATGKADEKRLGSYQEFENEAKTNQFDLYQNLSAYGFKEEEIGSWRDFSGLINRKLISGREPNITPYASETETFRETSKIKDNTALRPNYPAVPTKEDTPAEVGGGQEVQVGGQDNELDIKKTPKVENPDAPFKYRTADTVFVVDPSSRKAYDMSGNPAPDAILSEALESRIDPIKQTKDSQMPTQELLNRNDRMWLEAQIRDKSEQVRALRDKGRAGVEGAVGAPYYASQAAVQTNLSEIEPIEAELTDLQRQYAKLEYNDINNGVHKRLFSEFEKTPEYKALQSRYEKLISTVPITISDEARQDFNAKYGGEIETLQAQLTQKSMEEFSKSQELAGLQAKYQKDMDEFVRANRSKPIFDSMYREKVKAVTAEIEREQVKLFNQLYGQQIDKEVSELSNNKFMEYMKANPDKFQDYNNKVQNYINNFNELAGADFQKTYGKEFQAEVGKAMLEKIRSTDFLKDDFTTTSTEFILRGFDDSVLGGIVGRLSGVNRSDQQIEDYYNPTMIEGAARGALSIVVDTPLFAIPGAGGAAIAARGTSLLARRFILNAVAKGAPLKVAERAVMAAWKTRFATTTGIGGSMGALGGYDQIRDLYTQSFDDTPGIDMKQNLKATGKGLVLGFGIGWIGMGSRVMNNYINKSLDNVFASQVVRKGVEQTARAGVNLSALTVENAAFVYGGSFLEGREATPEEFGEGMVLLGFLKAKGYFSKVAKAVPLRDKPQIDFTREELEYLTKPNNKEAWKRVNEMGELEMRSVFEDPNAPLTMKMKIAASRGVTVDDTFINTDGAKAVVVSDNGKFYVEYRSKEGELLQKAEFSTAEQATTQAMTLEALTVAKEAMTKYDKLGATEKAKVNAELKPEEKQAVADVVDGKVTEEGFVAVEKLHRLTNEEIKKEDAKIEENQKRLGLPNTPETALSGQTKETIAKLERGEPVPNEFLEQASRELYENYKKVESIKNSTNRKFTTDQIEKSSSELGKMIEFLENAKSLQKESGRFISEVDALDGTNKVDRVAPKEVKSEEANPVVEAKPVEAEVKPVEEVKPEVKTVEAVAPEVKPTQEAKVEPTPEVKVEPKGEVKVATELEKIEQDKKDELKKRPSRMFPIKKYNPNGENEVLEGDALEYAEARIERIIEKGIEAGKSVEEIHASVNQGHAFGLGAETTTIRNFIKDRVDGKTKQTFAEFRKDTHKEINNAYETRLKSIGVESETKSLDTESKISAEVTTKKQRKEAWEKTIDEYNENPIKAGRVVISHRFLVETALKEGKDVPKEVLDEYPTLKRPTPEVKAEPTKSEAEVRVEPDKAREELSDIDAAITELRQNNPKEFKKDGTLKANSKLSVTLKSLIDRQNKLIEEFPERSAIDKEKSRMQTEEINRQFEERQAQLAESTKITKEEILEASIEDKLRFRAELSKEEIDYANENYFVPKGFRFGKFGLETIKTETATKAEPKSAWATEQAAIESDTKLTAEQKEAAKVESTAKALEGVDGKYFNDVAISAKETLEWSVKDLIGNRSEISSEKEFIDRALEDGRYSNLFPTKQGQSTYAKSIWKAELQNRIFESKKVSEAYHRAKSDGSNPELVRAVEKLLGQSVQESVQVKAAPTAEVGKESVQVDVEAKRKALDDSINTLKETLKPKMGITFDPKREAEDMYKMHKAIVEVAKKAIDYYGTKVIKTAEDFAKVLGTKLTKPIRLAYEEAAGIATYTAETLKYNYGRAVEQLSNITATPEKTVGVAARDISRRETTKVLIDEFKALKDQIRLESKSAKQAATFIAKFLDANKKEIAEVGLTVRDTTRIQKVAVKSEKSAIDLMDKMINDAGYRKALKDAEASQKQIKRAIAYGEFNLSKVEKETLNKVATIDLDGHFFSREFLDSYNAMKKQVFENRRVPSPEAIGKFYSLYEQDIIDNHVRKELAQEVDAKTVDTVVKRIDSLYEQLQEWNTDPTKIDRKEIALAKGRLSYLLTKANNFIKNGVFEVDNQKVKDLDSRLAELENFINNDAEPINKAIEGIESSYKNTEVRNLDLRPVSSVNLKLRGVNKYAAETATRLRRALKTARDSKVSDKLSLNDIENIKAVLSGIDSGYIPKITTKIIEKIETADLVNKSGNEIVSAIKNNILSNKIIRERLAKYPTTQSLARVLDKWDKADIDKMLNLETKRKGKPIEELITGALEQPLFKSNQELDKVLRPVSEARAKALAAKFWNPVEYFRNKSKAETYDNMIGIALRSLNHIANLPTTLKKAEINGEYEIVLQDGKRYEEGGSPKKFATIEDANNFIRDNVEKFFTADELDFYHTVNFGKFKTQRANAKLSENALITEREIEKFDKAYEALKKLTGTDRIYFKTFDELTSKLPAKLKPYIEAMRDALESSKDIASEVATREGVNFVHNDSYWPYPNKELNVGRQGKTDIQDFASTMKAENVKSGNIYERTQSVHYTDFNARRVFEGYMRTMLTDYYMNPESKVVLGALREVSRGLGKEYRRDGELSAETKIVVDALEQLIKDRFIAHLSSHQLFDGMVFGKKVGGSTYIFDVGKLGRDILGFGRSVALVSAARRVIPEPVSNISKILGGFIRKGDKFNPLRISDKAEALLPVLEDVSGSVRSLSSQRFQKGNYDQFELQQDRNAIREFSEKYILQLGDMLTMRPLWVTKFETRFKELTGKEIDPAEWQRNEEYKDSNYDAVIRSMRYADSVIEEVFPAQTKFGRAQTGAFGIRTASDVGALNMIMNSFGVRESSTFVLALNDFRYGTNLGRADAAGRLAGLTAANFIWLASGQMVYSGTKYLFGLINDDEAAKEKALEAWRNAFSAEGITTNIVANVALLLTGRYANAGRLIAGITAGFAIDKILDAEPDPIERANMRASIKQGLAQLRTIGMTVPESETDRINMLFPIIAQSMSELGIDAANVGTYVVDLGKKVADGTASEDDIQLWTLLKATHDMMILKGYTHPFTKEMNMYLREKSRGELKSVETYTSSIKQLYKGAEYKPEKADEVAQKVKLLYENFKKKSIDESNSFEAMWGAMSATENVLENLESLKNKEASDAMKIRRLPYPERYRYLQDKYPDNRGEWSPYVTKGFSRYLYIKDSYETGSVEDRDKMFDLE